MTDKQIIFLSVPLFFIAHFYLTGIVMLIIAVTLDSNEKK